MTDEPLYKRNQTLTGQAKKKNIHPCIYNQICIVNWGFAPRAGILLLYAAAPADGTL
jgi:hypothetical protein